MKGNLVPLCAALLFAGLMGSTSVAAQDVVINELNLVVGPETGQFVELHGAAGTELDGHALAVVKSLHYPASAKKSLLRPNSN